MAELNELRGRIDEIDGKLIELFAQRMDVAAEIAQYKRERGLPVLDRSRERAKLEEVYESSPEGLKSYSQVLYSLLFEVSRAHQSKLLGKTSDLTQNIRSALSDTADLFPQRAFVACQGVEGAYSQIAADRIFKHPSISYFSSFDGVFKAVEQGFCDYGVIPLENSTAGSVNQVYDLMMSHRFHIVRTARVKVDHCLLAKPGCKVEDIRDIYSHEQAISQCNEFLSSLKDVRVHVCENTAVAAKMVKESDRADVAAISSRSCAELWGLETLARNVQDRGNNYTRFACISRSLEIFPGADRTSLMIVLNHEPGALCKVLERFFALDINITKLESRPIPDRDFEFMFYFDIECPVTAPEFSLLTDSIGEACEEFRYLGSYSEVV